MTFFKKTNTVILFSLLCVYSGFAKADSTYSIGLLASYSSSIYKGIDDDSILVPAPSYDSATFFFKSLSFGYHLSDNLDVAIGYQTTHFDPHDSTDGDIQRLDKRGGGFTADAAFKYGIFNTKVRQDISGKHNGFIANVGLGVPLLFTKSFFVKGGFKYNYISKKMSEHLYSVSTAESNIVANRIATHASNSTSNKQYSLQFIAPLSKQTTIITILSHTEYDDETTASPLIEKSSNNSATFIASYKF